MYKEEAPKPSAGSEHSKTNDPNYKLDKLNSEVFQQRERVFCPEGFPVFFFLFLKNLKRHLHDT